MQHYVLLLSLIFSSSLLVKSQNNSTGVTFKVSEVPRASVPLNDTFHRIAIENFSQKEIFQLPKDKEDQRIVPIRMNGFAETVYYAYDQHRPLALSPDDIWLLIAQGISLHVNVNFDSLSPLLLKEDRPKEIRIRNDDLANSADAWGDLINDLSKETQKYIQSDVLKFMSPEFSTTTPLITTTYNLTLLETLEEAFSYAGESGCGIPEITILGTQQDWRDIKERLRNLDHFGLNYWRIELEPVLDEFISVFEKKPNIPFWESIFKAQQFYGSMNITGWMLKFFPYIKKYEYVEVNEEDFMKKEVYEKNPFITGMDYHFSTLGTNSLPKGSAEIDLLWDQYLPSGEFKQDSIKLYAGFVGIKQNPKTLQLRPEISWYAVKTNAPEIYHDLESNYTKHDNRFLEGKLWTSNIVDSALTLPIFDPNKYDDHALSLVGFKKILTNKLGKNYKGTKLSFVVTWSGSIAQIRVTNDKLSEAEKLDVISKIEQFNVRWKPATNKVDEQFFIMTIDEEIRSVNVNFLIHLEL